MLFLIKHHLYVNLIVQFNQWVFVWCSLMTDCCCCIIKTDQANISCNNIGWIFLLFSSFFVFVSVFSVFCFLLFTCLIFFSILVLLFFDFGFFLSHKFSLSVCFQIPRWFHIMQLLMTTWTGAGVWISLGYCSPLWTTMLPCWFCLPLAWSSCLSDIDSHLKIRIWLPCLPDYSSLYCPEMIWTLTVSMIVLQ